MICPLCQSPMISHGKRKKVIHHPFALDFDGNIIWFSRRYKCKNCDYTMTEENPFTFSGMNESFAVARRIMVELRNLNSTYTDIAQRTYVSVTTVQIYADSWLNVPRQKLTESIGIDEYHSPSLSKPKSSYLAVIVDNKGRQLLDVLPSRKKEELLRYFTQIPLEERRQVKYVTIDMWEPYRDIAYTCFPCCLVAIDPFHVIKNLGAAFSRIRIRIMNEAQYDSTNYYLLKKWHYLLEKDIDLDNKPRYNHRFQTKLNYRDLFNMILEIHTDLTKAYQLKEKYRKFNKEATIQDAREELELLILEFEKADIAEYRDIVQMLIHWKEEIIHSFYRPYEDRKLSNSFCENVNGKINAYVVISRGMNNFSRFRNRVLYALNDNVFYSLTQFLSRLKRKGKPRGTYKK